MGIWKKPRFRLENCIQYGFKQDVALATNVDELTDRLGLRELHDRVWNIQLVCDGSGVLEGFKWISEKVTL